MTKPRIPSPLKYPENLTPIPGFPGYAFDVDGCLFSCHKGGWRRLSPEFRPSDGRARHKILHESGRLLRRYRSYFVLLATKGPRPLGMEACHNNGNCQDDSPGNLRWDTPASNKEDMANHGTVRRGNAHYKTKIRDEELPSIIARRGEPLKQIAAEYGVTIQQICAIQKGRSRA